ncbi:N-acetyltransferase, partial [Pyxidicoccus sp. 3LG]
RLLRELQEEAAKARVPLKLRVLRDGPARRLYARLGFQPDAAVPASEGEPYLAMEWAPTPRGG